MDASGLCGRGVSVKDAAVNRWLARIPRTDDSHSAWRPSTLHSFCSAVFKCLICRRGAGYPVMGFAEGFTAILAAYAAISVLSSLVRPPADGMRRLKARGVAYGRVRLWGSLAFILANVAG
jgi:hypothetical protein